MSDTKKEILQRFQQFVGRLSASQIEKLSVKVKEAIRFIRIYKARTGAPRTLRDKFEALQKQLEEIVASVTPLIELTTDVTTRLVDDYRAKIDPNYAAAVLTSAAVGQERKAELDPQIAIGKVSEIIQPTLDAIELVKRIYSDREKVLDIARQAGGFAQNIATIPKVDFAEVESILLPLLEALTYGILDDGIDLAAEELGKKIIVETSRPV